MRYIHYALGGGFCSGPFGMAGVQEGPTSEQRKALAPTGKLVSDFFPTPIHGTKDAASGEFKGPRQLIWERKWRGDRLFNSSLCLIRLSRQFWQARNPANGTSP